MKPGASKSTWTEKPTKLDFKHGTYISGKSNRKILGRDVAAASGQDWNYETVVSVQTLSDVVDLLFGRLTGTMQIVRHASGGAHTPGKYDRDYLSGGEDGHVLDVCGDYAQVFSPPMGSLSYSAIQLWFRFVMVMAV